MIGRIKELIESLDLVPHPEGGWYREVHRSSHAVQPDDDRESRSALTAIYFLLPSGTMSHWHRVASDEIWTFVEGDPLTLWQFDGTSTTKTLVGAFGGGVTPTAIVPANVWQAAEPSGDYTLVACSVAPGFDFADFTLGDPPGLPEEFRRLARPASYGNVRAPRMRRPPTALLLSIIAAVIVMDQLTKRFVRAALTTPHEYFGGFLTLLHAENEGAFLSIGANLPPGIRTAIFSGVVGIALVAALWALMTGRIASPSDAAATAFIIGGGIGNLIDRVIWDGRVTDFAYLRLGALHTGVFNVADIAITGGVLWLALASFFSKSDDAKSETPAAT